MEETPRFAADRMLGRLARWLRLLGVDVTYSATLGGAALLSTARADSRIVLTRDKRLRTAADVIYLESNDFRGQLKEVLARAPFDPRRHAFTRCSRCNGELIEVARELVGLRIPPYVYATNERLAECTGCGQLYWGATHRERALRELDLMGV
jgi:hypothetical protein